jgi:TIR domain
MEDRKAFTAPLHVYVLWHPSFEEGRQYFAALFSLLCRDVNQPLQRGAGIPVFQRSAAAKSSDHPLPVAWKEAERNVVVLLIDNGLCVQRDWHGYVESVLAEAEKYYAFVLPVSLTANAFGMIKALQRPQFVRLHELGNTASSDASKFKKRFDKLGVVLMQELVRLMQSQAGAAMPVALPKVKLFISHAKADGEQLARKFMLHVRNDYPLDTFFDANDMPYGQDFPEHIKSELKNGVVVVFHTDAYATREWCKNEVIWAKRYLTPVLVVNAVEGYEKRSFPYMGNGPVIRFNRKKKDFAAIIKEAVYLAMYNLHAQLQIAKYVAYYWHGAQKPLEFGNLPELLHYETILKYKAENQLQEATIIYPDPPLGSEEGILLNSISDEVRFITPLELSAQYKP